MVSLWDQLHAFAVTALGGVAMGVLFDCLRVVRRWTPRRALLPWMLDLLYWAVVAPLMAGLLFFANWGELRLYVLLGIGTGLALYFAFVSGPVLAALWAVSRGMVALAAWAAHLVLAVAALPAVTARTAAYGMGLHRWLPGRRASGSGPRRRLPWPVGLAWRRR